MGALLAIATFAFFILLDYLLTRRAEQREAQAIAAAIPASTGGDMGEVGPRLDPVWVAGYELPEALHYHRGHTWARIVGKDTVAIGIDDFSRRLVGKANGVELPIVGAYVRQGGRGATIESDGRAADVIAPVDGEVVAVNPDLEDQPNLVTDDPYGRGWLLKIRSTNLADQ